MKTLHVSNVSINHSRSLEECAQRARMSAGISSVSSLYIPMCLLMFAVGMYRGCT